MYSILLLKYIKWHFLDAPKQILEGLKNIIWFGWNYFSIGLLLRTLFAPWRRIQWSQEKGFHPGSFLYTLASNLISRILGAIVRSFLIFIGLAVEVYLIVYAVFMLLFWLALIPIIILSIAYGIFLLF
jgi:hypothetical protein